MKPPTHDISVQSPIEQYELVRPGVTSNKWSIFLSDTFDAAIHFPVIPTFPIDMKVNFGDATPILE